MSSRMGQNFGGFCRILQDFAEFGRIWQYWRLRGAWRRGGEVNLPGTGLDLDFQNSRTPGTWRCWRIVDAARDRQHHLSDIGGCRGESRNWQGTGEELAGTGRNWQESGQNLLGRRFIYRKGVVFETNLAKRTEKATANRSRGSKIALGGLKRGLAGTLSLQKGPLGGPGAPLGAKRAKKCSFRGPFLGPKWAIICSRPICKSSKNSWYL